MVSLYVLIFGCLIYDSDCTVCTGHVVSVVCLICRLLGSNKAKRLYALDMWSVLFVMYVCGMFKYSDWTERTGYVVSVLCSICGCWDLIYRSS